MTDNPRGFEMPDEQEWLELKPEAVSSDFVRRTLERVMADRDEPGGFAFPPGFLEAYAPPDPSPGFVARVAGSVTVGEVPGDLREVVTTYSAPEPSPDFVARTLRALRGELRPLERRRPVRVGPWARAALLAAAAVVASVFLWPRSDAEPEGMRAVLASAWEVHEAPRYTPNPAAALFSRTLQRTEPQALTQVYVDPLLALAQEGDE